MKNALRRILIGGVVAGVAFALGYVLFRLILGEVRMSDLYDVEVPDA